MQFYKLHLDNDNCAFFADWIIGAAQMSILENLLFNLCESGSEQVDDIDNFYLQVLAPASSQLPLSTLYFLNSHGQIPSLIHNSDYDVIKQSQIDWFANASQAQRSAREKIDNDNRFYLSLTFLHISFSEFEYRRFSIRNDYRRESTESPNFNFHFYDVLVKGGILTLNCEHDHVNDFCVLLPQQTQQNDDKIFQFDSWLCYGGGSEFRKYCSFDEERFHRRMRVWKLDTNIESLKTWKRVEYVTDKVNELMLVKSEAVIDIFREKNEGRRCVVS